MRIYNYYNCSNHSTLIYPDVIITSRALTCSNVVHIYSCRALACCSLWTLYGFTIGEYDGTEIGSPEGSTDITTGD